MHENENGEQVLEKNLKSILKKWKFPSSIIKKYEEKGIVEIFDWQAQVLNNDQVSGISIISINLSLFFWSGHHL